MSILNPDPCTTPIPKPNLTRSPTPDLNRTLNANPISITFSTTPTDKVHPFAYHR